MTPTPSSPPPLTLVERCALTLLNEERDNRGYLPLKSLADCEFPDRYLRMAKVVCGVVLDECAKLCDLPAFGVDATAFGEPVKWSRPPTSYEIAKRIRNLSPQEPKP